MVPGGISRFPVCAPSINRSLSRTSAISKPTRMPTGLAPASRQSSNGSALLWIVPSKAILSRPNFSSSTTNVEIGKRSAALPNVRRRLGMDAQRLLAVSWLPRCSRRAWRVQRQIHVQPIRPARWFLRHIPHSYPPHLSQFLSTGKTLAVHRNQTRTRSQHELVGRDRRARRFFSIPQ